MQKPPSKADLRRELETQLERFLHDGKEVQQIPKGVSGKETGANFQKPMQWQMEKSEGERTYLPEVVQRLDQRKHSKPVAPSRHARKRPKKKLIYDDFGEPLRWVWIEE